MVFTVLRCGFTPRCALEVIDGGSTRISKIENLIEECPLGIHDISRTELDAANALPRFNMPLELGLFLRASGAKMRSLWRTHSLLPSFRGREAEPEIQRWDAGKWAEMVGLTGLSQVCAGAKLRSSPLWIPGSASRPRNDVFGSATAKVIPFEQPVR